MGVLLPATPPGQALAVDDLASSFARALARFYPFAGRLAVTDLRGDDVTTDTAAPCCSVSLRCTDEGAEFVHAAAPAVTVTDVVEPLYVPRELVWSFFQFNEVLSTHAATGSLPVLAAQVTELADGVFVAVSLSHAVADGTTFWHFFNTWSQISRGQEVSTPAPVLERWFPETCPVPPIPLPLAKLENTAWSFECPPLEECFFAFSAESVKMLKAKANAEMAGTATSTISSLQSLFAHVWRAVSTRRRSPCSPGAGDASRPFRTPTWATRSRSARRAPPPATSRRRGSGGRRGVVRRGGRAELALGRWCRKPAFASLGWHAPAAVTMGNSQRFDVYGNDFGWGRPVAVRSGGGDKADGRVTVYEGRDVGGGGMAMEVCLAPDTLARLVADAEFMDAVAVA